MIKKTVGSVVTSYVYNIENRLTEVWDGEVGSSSLIASYYYDPFGRRLWKEVSGVRTHFHYTDEGLIGEYDAVGNELRTYGYKPGSTWTTDPLFMKEAGQYYFYHNDHLGTPQKLTSVNGAVVWSAAYSSFGEATINVAVVENSLRFPGQYYDSETGLHYNFHRYYDSSTGRYIRADPIGSEGGINLFAYVHNNPVNFFDLWGLYPGQQPPPPPGYNPDTWGARINPNGKWEVIDPKTGKRWVAHAEDEEHWRHWDDPDKKGSDKRWPRKTKKKWPNQKRKVYGEQSECDPSGDAPEWEPPLDEFSTIDPFGNIVPIDQPVFISPVPSIGSMPPVFVPRLILVPAFY